MKHEQTVSPNLRPCIETQLTLGSESISFLLDQKYQKRDLQQDVYLRVITYLNRAYQGRFSFCSDTAGVASNIPVPHHAFYHKFFIQNGRRYTAAEMMDTKPRNSLVDVLLDPQSNLSWVGEIMNIITIAYSTGVGNQKDSFVQICWLQRPTFEHQNDRT